MRHGNNRLSEDTATHGLWQRDSPLFPDGREEVERVRAAHLAGMRFSFLGHSSFERARETAAIVVPDRNWYAIPGLEPLLIAEFDDIYRMLPADQQPQDLDQVEARMPGFCERQANHILHTATEILQSIEPGESALFVSHQPLLGLLRGMIDRSFPPREQSLPKAGIYKFRFNGKGTLLGTDVLLPPPK